MHGSIDVAKFMQEEVERGRLSEDCRDMLERQRRNLEREEELTVLRRYYRAGPAARRTVVEENRVVFDRIAANRQRARAIAREERDAADRYYLAQGYAIRPRGVPRYVRPDWNGAIASEWQERGKENELPHPR